jgi:uncharacterized protein YggE
MHDVRRALEGEKEKLAERLVSLEGLMRMAAATDGLVSKMEALSAENERLGEVLTALANASVCPMLQLSYTVKDPETAKKALLTAAVADAKEKAQLLAEASGTKLKALQSVDHTAAEPSFEAYPTHMLDADMSAKGRIEMNLEPDEITITDHVTCVWEME